MSRPEKDFFFFVSPHFRDFSGKMMIPYIQKTLWERVLFNKEAAQVPESEPIDTYVHQGVLYTSLGMGDRDSVVLLPVLPIQLIIQLKSSSRVQEKG